MRPKTFPLLRLSQYMAICKGRLSMSIISACAGMAAGDCTIIERCGELYAA